MRKLAVLLIALILILGINANAQWVQKTNGAGNYEFIRSFTAIGTTIYAAASDTVDDVDSMYSTVLKSINSGDNWSQTGLVLHGDNVTGITALGADLFAGADTFVCRSTNSGSNWITSLVPLDVHGIAAIDNYVFAGGYHWTGISGVYRTSNNGVNWVYTDLHIPVYSFVKLGSNIYAGTDQSGVYVSSNNGLNWIPRGLTNKHIRSLAAFGSSIFAGTDSGIYVSGNNGTSWGLSAMSTGLAFSLVVSGTCIIASMYPGGIFVSTDNGVSWVEKNQGFTGNPIIPAIFIAGNYIFAGTYGQSVWRRPLSEVIGIQTTSAEIPSKYSLYQNYPNPFNPSTFIKFDVAKSSFVTLRVFDALGREVAVLVNQDLKPGTCEADWNASNYPSGVYFYSLSAEGYGKTKKMILIK